MKRISYILLALSLAVIMSVITPLQAVAQTSVSTFVITESNGTAYSDLPIMVDQNNTLLVAQTKIDANALDTRVLKGSTALPHLVASDRVLFVDDVLPSTSQSYQFTADNTALASMPVIIGYGGEIRTEWAYFPELGDDFTLTIAGYTKTPSASTVHIAQKHGSWDLRQDTSGDITFEIFWQSPGYAALATDGTYLYAVGEMQIQQYDLTLGDPLAVIEPTGWVNASHPSAVWDGTYLYASSFDNDIVQVDVATMTIVGTFTNTENIKDLAYDATYLYAAESTGDLIQIDKATMTENDRFVGAGGDCSTTFGGGFAYLAYTIAGPNLKISKIDPAGMNETASYTVAGSFGGRADIVYDSGYVYPNYTFTPAKILKVDVATMTLASSWTSATGTDSSCGTIYGDGTYVYAKINSVATGGDIVQIQMSDMSEIDRYTGSVDGGASQWAGDGTTLFIMDGGGGDFAAIETTTMALDYSYIYYLPGETVTAPVVSDGLHSIVITADTTDLVIDIDGGIDEDTETLTDFMASNAQPTIWLAGGMPYATNILANVSSSTDTLQYQPNDIVATTTGSGIVDSGTTTTVVDAALPAGTWTYARLTVTDTTDDAAPKGESSIVTSVSGGTTFNLETALTVAVEAGDTYEVEYGTLPDLDLSDGNSQAVGIIAWGENPITATTTNLNVETSAATNVTPTSATLNGILTNLGGFTTVNVFFQWGTSTDYGNTTPPVAQTATTIFAADITGLHQNVTYHFRAVGQTPTLTVYGDDMTFTAAESSTVVQISRVGVFESYMATGDMLFCVEIINTYRTEAASYYPSQDPGRYFHVQLLDTDGVTVLGASPLRDWGDKPISIYLKPALAASITPGGAYSIKALGLFSGAPSDTYAIQPDDWYGDDLYYLDRWIITTITNMQIYYERTDFLDVLTDVGIIVTSEAGGYFSMGIPGIAQVRPDLFAASQSKPQFTSGTANNVFDAAALWQNQVGPLIAYDAGIWGDLFDMEGKNFLGYAIIGVMLLITTGAVLAGGKALGALLLNVPLLTYGNYLRVVPIQITMIFAIIMAYFFVRQFFIKTM